jgi:hypothetical protein
MRRSVSVAIYQAAYLYAGHTFENARVDFTHAPASDNANSNPIGLLYSHAFKRTSRM